MTNLHLDKPLNLLLYLWFRDFSRGDLVLLVLRYVLWEGSRSKSRGIFQIMIWIWKMGRSRRKRHRMTYLGRAA